MGHLGYERTLELIRERFYWPQMNDELKHFVGKICKCVKDNRPVRLSQAPQRIISSAPMEFVGLDFLHLDACVDGFASDNITLPDTLKSTQPVTKKPKLQQRSYLTTKSCDSECQGKL